MRPSPAGSGREPPLRFGRRMAMLRRPLVVLLLLASASLALLPSPAAADCLGPTIRRIEPAVRGEVITVRGYAFGDNCYDTGPPPAGEGVLGVPVPDVELFVAQGDGEVLVARGAANADYEFSVDIVVPPRLSPGPARVVARWGTDRSAEQALEVLTDPPVAEPPGTTPIVPFGSVPDSTVAPSTSSVTEPAPVSEDDGDGVEGALVGGVLVVVLIGAIGAVRRFRRRKTM